MALCNTWLKNEYKKERDSVVEKADRDGLSVRCSTKGKLTFQIRYRYAGKQQRCDIGTYPLISLADARTEAMRFRAELEEGRDPRVVKRVELLKVVTAGLFEPTFRQWRDSTQAAKRKTKDEIMRSFEIYIFPKFGKDPINELTFHGWLTRLEEIAADTPCVAQRILTDLKMFYRWAVRRQLLDRNILADISGSQDLNIHRKVGKRSLNDEEIRLVFWAMDETRLWPKTKYLIELLLFYGCRIGELRLAKITDFDFQKMVWTVPPENHKTGSKTDKPILRPIIPEIVPLLKAAMLHSRGEYLFTLRREARPMNDRAHVDIPFRLIDWLNAAPRKKKMPHWSIHDLRKTARTNWSSLTRQQHVAEIMLGHKLPGVWQVYDHYDYLPEQAEIYKAWWYRLQQIRFPEQFENVVQLNAMR